MDVFFKKIPDRFFKEIILSFPQLGREHSDSLGQLRIQGGVIYFSFSHERYPWSKRSVGWIIGQKIDQQDYGCYYEFDHFLKWTVRGFNKTKSEPPAIKDQEIDGNLYLWGKERSLIADGPRNTLKRICLFVYNVKTLLKIPLWQIEAYLKSRCRIYQKIGQFWIQKVNQYNTSIILVFFVKWKEEGSVKY